MPNFGIGTRDIFGQRSGLSETQLSDGFGDRLVQTEALPKQSAAYGDSAENGMELFIR